MSYEVAFFVPMAFAVVIFGLMLWLDWRDRMEFERDQADFRRYESAWMLNLIRQARESNRHEA